MFSHRLIPEFSDVIIAASNKCSRCVREKKNYEGGKPCLYMDPGHRSICRRLETKIAEPFPNMASYSIQFLERLISNRLVGCGTTFAGPLPQVSARIQRPREETEREREVQGRFNNPREYVSDCFWFNSGSNWLSCPRDSFFSNQAWYCKLPSFLVFYPCGDGCRFSLHFFQLISFLTLF